MAQARAAHATVADESAGALQRALVAEAEVGRLRQEVERITDDTTAATAALERLTLQHSVALAEVNDLHLRLEKAVVDEAAARADATAVAASFERRLSAALAEAEAAASATLEARCGELCEQVR